MLFGKQNSPRHSTVWAENTQLPIRAHRLEAIPRHNTLFWRLGMAEANLHASTLGGKTDVGDAVKAGSLAWHWLRVYYHSPNKDSLITESIWPALGALLQSDLRSYFQRDIVGGPNVLVGIRGDDNITAATLPSIVRRIEDYLASHPSTESMSPEEYARAVKVAHRWDRINAQTALLPNNTVVVNCPEPQVIMTDDPALKEAMRNFLCSSSGLAADCLHHIGGDSVTRQQLAWDILVAFAWIANPLQLSSTISYRSHANAFLDAPEARKLKQIFESAYERARPSVHARLKASVAALTEGRWPAWGLEGYATLIRGTLLEAYWALRQHRYRLPSMSLAVPDDRLGTSRLAPDQHRRLLLFIDGSASMRAWVVCVNFTYLFLKQLGVTPVDRYWTCYMIGRGVEETYSDPMIAIRAILEHSNSGWLLPIFEDFESS